MIIGDHDDNINDYDINVMMIIGYNNDNDDGNVLTFFQ